ncbi:hypothetical protein ACLBXX_04335 [Microbacterium sp. C23T]
MIDDADVVTPAATPAVRDARRAWILGGSLLIASATLGLIAQGSWTFAFPAVGVAIDLVWSAALLVFALGIRGSGSVVGRQSLGIAALVVAAAAPLASRLVWWMLPLQTWDATTATSVGTLVMVLSPVALIVATVVIGRAGAVPDRLRWVPLIVVAVAVGAQVLAQVFVVAAGGSLVQPDLVAVVFGSAAIGTLGVLLLGILAIVFAPRESPRPAAPTQVYPPAS